MGQSSQRHRQEFQGQDSSGRPPEPGRVTTPAQAAFIAFAGPATAVSDLPASISIQGTWPTLQTITVTFTDDNTGAQTTGILAITAGTAENVANQVATAIDALVDTSVVLVGSRIELRPASPATTVTINTVVVA